jgi:hypothetical protein
MMIRKIAILLMIMIVGLTIAIFSIKKKEGMSNESTDAKDVKLVENPRESDKMLVIQEIFTNLNKHQTRIRVLDTSSSSSSRSDSEIQPIKMKSREQCKTDRVIFHNIMDVILPILEKHEDILKDLAINGHIQSKELKDLNEIKGCGEFNIKNLKSCNIVIPNINVDKLIDELITIFQFARRKDRHHRIENERDYNGLRNIVLPELKKKNAISAEKKDELTYHYDKIFGGWNGMDENAIYAYKTALLQEKTDLEIFKNKINPIVGLAMKYNVLINNTDFLLKRKDALKNAAIDKDTKTNLQNELAKKAYVDNDRTNPYMTEDLALDKIEFSMLMTISSIIKYHESQLNLIQDTKITELVNAYS